MSIMKNENEKVEKLIKEALSKEDAKYYSDLEEQNFIVQYGQMFKGKQGFFTVMTTLMIFVFLGVTIYCFMQFMDSSETKDQILYATIIIMSVFSIGMLKLWNWMQMDKNTVIREMKRLELQVAVLVEKNKQ